MHLNMNFDAVEVATEFAISLVRRLVASDSRVISKLHPLVDALAKLATRPDASEALRRQLVEITRSLSASSFGLPSSKYDFAKFLSSYRWSSKVTVISFESHYHVKKLEDLL
ncbi:CCR4-NOT transcription complex subunit 1 isoform X1, partial [Tanacetum coccineum]